MVRLATLTGAVGLCGMVSTALGQPSVPADWDEAVIDACESAADFAPADEGAYADCRLTTTDTVRHQGQSVVWAFTAKEGTASVALSHPPGPLKGRGAVSVWLKNPEGHDLGLGLRLVGNDGQAYDSERVRIGDARMWRQLVFLTDDLRPVSAPGAGGPGLEFPWRGLDLVLEGAIAGRRYTLYLDDLAAYGAPPEELEVLAILARQTAQPGEDITAQVRVKPPAALKRAYPLTLALLSGGVTIAEADLPFDETCTAWPAGTEVASGPVKLRVPGFVAGGEYALRVKAPGLALLGEAAMGLSVQVEAEAAAPTSVQVAEHNGVPTTMLGETPISLWGRFRLSDSPTEAATPLPILPATATHDPYGWASDVWLARDVWDYEALDRTVISALQAQPDAHLVLRVFLEAPDWWDAENPGELILFSHGRHAAKIPGIPDKQTFASFSSAKWRADAAEALRRFIAHVEQAPYANRVVGYELAGGEDGRWRYWGAAEGLYADYSRPQRAAFIAWLRSKYGDDIRNLRAKWQEIVRPLPAAPEGEEPIPTLTVWEDIRVPDIAARTDHPSQSLLDPSAAPQVADYNLFHAEQVAGLICDLAATAKQACERRKLVGVSYGHFLDHARSADELPNAGHLAPDLVLTSSDLDLIAAPGMAGGEPPASVHQVWSSLAASVRAHGKIPVLEVLPGEADASDVAAQMLVIGGTVWAGEADDAAKLRAYSSLAQAALAWDRRPTAEIALVVDHLSLAYLAEGNALSLPLLTQQCASLDEVGAPYDVWMLDDLIAGRMPDYKLYVIADAFDLDQRARQAIRDQLARDGKTVLWIYAPGAMDESLSGRTAFEVTDLAIGFVPKAAPLRVKIVDSAHPLIDGVTKGLEYGTTEPTGPVFFALPTRGEVLGTIRVPSQLDKGAPREWAGLIASESETWTTIFSAAPNVPAELLRPIARRAGVHLYVDTGDLVYANASVLALHAVTSGDKRVRLPQSADVLDLNTQERLATNASEFRLAMPAGQTRLFRLAAPR